MRKLLRPQVLVPLVLSISLIGGLLSFSDLKQVVHVMSAFERLYLVVVLLLMALYELIRGVQWHLLLRALGVRGPLQPEAFSFLMGEVAKGIPIGNYFQNYLLDRVEGADFARTSAASTLIILTEVAISLVGLVIIGVDDWGWLRPVILIGLFVAFVLSWAIYRMSQSADPPNWLMRHGAFRRLLEQFHHFQGGVEALLTPSTLVRQAALGAAYLLVGAGVLYAITLGLQVPHLTFWQVLAVYFFSLAVGLIFPLRTDVGVVELSGVGALAALGVGHSEAVGIMIINRLLNLGASLTIALISLVFLRQEVAILLGNRAQRRREAQVGNA